MFNLKIKSLYIYINQIGLFHRFFKEPQYFQ